MNKKRVWSEAEKAGAARSAQDMADMARSGLLAQLQTKQITNPDASFWEWG